MNKKVLFFLFSILILYSCTQVSNENDVNLLKKEKELLEKELIQKEKEVLTQEREVLKDVNPYYWTLVHCVHEVALLSFDF